MPVTDHFKHLYMPAGKKLQRYHGFTIVSPWWDINIYKLCKADISNKGMGFVTQNH